MGWGKTVNGLYRTVAQAIPATGAALAVQQRLGDAPGPEDEADGPRFTQLPATAAHHPAKGEALLADLHRPGFRRRFFRRRQWQSSGFSKEKGTAGKGHRQGIGTNFPAS